MENVTENSVLDLNKLTIIKQAERQSFFIMTGYFFISFLVLFSLYVSNDKHTLSLFFLQSAFFIAIPFFFPNTRMFLKEAVNYLMRKR